MAKPLVKAIKNINSNTTLVKVKYKIEISNPCFTGFKYNTC